MRVAFGALLLLLLIACGDGATSTSTTTSMSTACPAEAATTGTATFRSDVIPIFNRSCTFTSCHGGATSSTTTATHGVSLKGDAAQVHASIVSKSATEANMHYVTPGQPDESFLLRKLDADFCGMDESRCTDPNCREPMPKNSTKLSDKDRDTIRSWILSGALND